MSSVFSPRTLNGLGGLGWKGSGKRTRPEAGNQDALGHLPSAGHAPHEAAHLPRPWPPATRCCPWRPLPLTPRVPIQAPIRAVQATPSVTPGASRPLLGGRPQRPPASRPLVPLPRACLSRAQLHPGHSVNTLHASCPATTPTATACGVWSTAVQADHPTRAQCRSASARRPEAPTGGQWPGVLAAGDRLSHSQGPFGLAHIMRRTL